MPSQTEGSPERRVRTAETPSRSPSPLSNHSTPLRRTKFYRNAEPSQEGGASTGDTNRRRNGQKHLSEVKQAPCKERRDCFHFEDTRLDCPEELYNLTKLAEVSLAAAAGQIFCREIYEKDDFSSTPVQEFPEDLSRDSTDKEETHECLECGKRYSTSSNLARHRQTHRSESDKKARRCPQCDKLYVSMPAFAMHLRTHNQGCRCPFCGKCFSRPWLLQGHIRTHTGEKPFHCTVCSKAFADKSNLRAHVQTHSNLKPHVCTRCGKAFALKSYLYKHEESSCMKLSPLQGQLAAESADSSGS